MHWFYIATVLLAGVAVGQVAPDVPWATRARAAIRRWWAGLWS